MLQVWEISDFLHLSVRGRSKLIKKRKSFKTIFFIFFAQSPVLKEKNYFSREKRINFLTL